MTSMVRPDDDISRRRMGFPKKVLVPILCVLALAIVPLFVLRALFPSERLRQMAVTKLEDATGLSISVENAAISFVHWRVGIKVSGIEVSAPIGGTTERFAAGSAIDDSSAANRSVARLATIPQLGIAVSILPLLRKEIVVDELYVTNPRITLKLGGGPILRRAPAGPSRAPAGMPMSLSLSRAVVHDASVLLEDIRSNSVIELKHLDASTSVRGDKTSETLFFEGKSTLKEVTLRTRKRLPVEVPPLSIKASWKATFALKERLLNLERVSLRVLEFPVEASGRVNLAGAKPDLDIGVRIEKIPTRDCSDLFQRSCLKRQRYRQSTGRSKQTQESRERCRRRWSK